LCCAIGEILVSEVKATVKSDSSKELMIVLERDMREK